MRCCAVCRALGMPCRSVTNYMSAHDTNASLTIDTYIDANGDKLNNHPGSYTNDSCWNFHVWNDVWMDRTDLANGYGGWQSIDGTPQETSDSKWFSLRLRDDFDHNPELWFSDLLHVRNMKTSWAFRQSLMLSWDCNLKHF